MVDSSRISLTIPKTSWSELETNNLKTRSTLADVKNSLN
jgi:hypothetical protein